ncbi:Endothelial cell-selective adhesion molecule [Merluccius polli]|uniref:Endothelial cell-selective adhesion molecule n=1 Tax=Merluccius polli TaxID=89951 RepID=A0AA47NQ44_MERPO|nr:Endothelial cell-selective adhesion molecule [Merluccius polli]
MDSCIAEAIKISQNELATHIWAGTYGLRKILPLLSHKQLSDTVLEDKPGPRSAGTDILQNDWLAFIISALMLGWQAIDMMILPLSIFHIFFFFLFFFFFYFFIALHPLSVLRGLGDSVPGGGRATAAVGRALAVACVVCTLLLLDAGNGLTLAATEDLDCWDQLIQLQLSGSGDWAPCDSKIVEIPRKEMEVVKGQMAVLHAWYSPSSDIAKNTVIWHFNGNESKQVINFSSGEVGHGQNEFSWRVGFSVTMPSANLSIYINSTQESDSGRYFCSVIIPGAPGISGEMRLNVKVPPSPPVCSLAGNPVLNGNVTMSCQSSQGKPAPHYKWTKAAPTSEIFFSPMQNERQGTLRLSNLTKGMAGKYVCRASNTAGSDSCSINLDIITSSNTGVIAAATLGSVVGLVGMVLVLIFILRRRRDTEEEIANEIKEDAQAPKRVSWAKSNTGSDVVSKNGTLSSVATTPRPRDPHPPSFHYPYCAVPTSDTGSVINAYQLKPGETSTLQGLPGYNAGGGGGSTPSRKPKRPPSANGVPPHASRSPVPSVPCRTDGAQPQAPHPATPKVSASTLTRMGAVAVMVPMQSQAGSLV